MNKIHRMDSKEKIIKRSGDELSNALDPNGLYRWKELEEHLPIGRDFWHRRVKQGKAPSPIRIGTRCTLWRGSDVMEWLKNPETYQAPG
ncbi:helix-turn-helix transcriptional regulator [Oligella urethralis]|uniref:Predicted transcriptional regulator n=1 Tax=Oligella urethralis TaxID=90245 RepID=A0A2X1UMN9_9BURK|nr:AlpA family phage regulatory protein [Oligella urethralis]SPY08409.1 Predicted transcriptional regulator [Oligella urethralis]